MKIRLNGRALLLALAGCMLWIGLSFGQFAPGGTPSPYTLQMGSGEITAASTANFGFFDASAKTPGAFTATSTTAVVVTFWQSLGESSGLGTYTTAKPTTALNLSIYDGKIYQCANPVLGTSFPGSGLGPNSINCQIADALINAGTYSSVLMVPISVGGTLCSDWETGAMLRRLQVTGKRLQDLGLTAATGYAGQLWLVAHGGEQDAFAGTARATLATCIRNFAALWTSNGTGTARFFVPTESFQSNTTNSTVTGAQADAVASGCANCRQGANVDSLTGATNRQSSGTDPHLTQTGTANLASLDVTVITNCKNTAC